MSEAYLHVLGKGFNIINHDTLLELVKVDTDITNENMEEIQGSKKVGRRIKPASTAT